MSKSTIRMIIVAAVLFIVAVVAFGFMVRVVTLEANELSVQIETLQESNSQKASYARLQRLAEETTTDREELQQYFLNGGSGGIDFLNMVESLAPELGVSLSTDSLEEVKGSDGSVEWIAPTFSFTGSRERTQNFLKVLETLPYLVRLESVNMTSAGANNWQMRVKMQVRVFEYDQ